MEILIQIAGKFTPLHKALKIALGESKMVLSIGKGMFLVEGDYIQKDDLFAMLKFDNHGFYLQRGDRSTMIIDNESEKIYTSTLPPEFWDQISIISIEGVEEESEWDYMEKRKKVASTQSRNEAVEWIKEAEKNDENILVSKINDYQYRIMYTPFSNRLDLFVTNRKWHLIEPNKRGNFKNISNSEQLYQFIKQQLS